MRTSTIPKFLIHCTPDCIPQLKNGAKRSKSLLKQKQRKLFILSV